MLKICHFTVNTPFVNQDTWHPQVISVLRKWEFLRHQPSYILSQSKSKPAGQTLALTQASRALLFSVGIKSETLVFQCLTAVFLQDFNNLNHSFSTKGLLLFWKQQNKGHYSLAVRLMVQNGSVCFEKNKSSRHKPSINCK